MKCISFRVMFAAAMILTLGVNAFAGRISRMTPPFEQVFTKMFGGVVEIMSDDQVSQMNDQLSDEQKQAIFDFIGADYFKDLNEKLSETKRKMLDVNFKPGQKAQSFQRMLPDILAITNNVLTVEQLQKIIGSLDEAEVASLSFYLGHNGRAELFSKMSDGRVEAVMDKTADWVLIESSKRRLDKINDYTTIMYKRERVDGKLQDTEKILLKFRARPLAFYMKWLDGPFKGRELLYNEKIIGKDKIRVRESGLLGIIPVTLATDSALAKRGTNHLATEVGLSFLLGMIDNDYNKSKPAGDLKRVNHGIVKIGDHRLFKTESILPKKYPSPYYCYRMIHYLDFSQSLETKCEVFNWDDQLMEMYHYTEIKFNPGLTDQDFNPDNEEYDL